MTRTNRSAFASVCENRAAPGIRGLRVGFDSESLHAVAESRRQPKKALVRLVRLLCVVASIWGMLMTGKVANGQGAAPVLSLQVINPQTVQLTWPNQTPGYVLEYGGDSLPSFILWQGLPQTPTVQGSSLIVNFDRGSPATKRGFFRLVSKGAPAGIDYLLYRQNSDGSWGSASGSWVRDTEMALDALLLFGRTNNGNAAYSRGLSALGGFSARNNDDLSRQVIALAGAGSDVSTFLQQLTAAENADIFDSTQPGYPGRAWGIATGFGDSVIDSALVLRALKSGGRAGGLTIVNESLAASATSSAHSFVVPTGSSSLLIRARARSVPVRVRVTYPNNSVASFDFAAGSALSDVGFPIAAGTSSLTAQNLSTGAGTYSLEVSFVGPDGFNYLGITTPLSFLGLMQNSDGGWGIGPGSDSQLMATAEVMRTAAAWSGNLVAPSMLPAAAAWMLTHQNTDGGFSSEPPTSNANETALAMLALQAASPTSSLASASNWLKNGQLPDGSWGHDSLQTAAAVQAIRLAPVVSQIPNQTVNAGTAFATINLDSYVFDPDHADSQITWKVTGNTLLNVSIVNRVATITYPSGSNITEQLTFTATDPDGYTGSATAAFSVVAFDYVITRGNSVTGSRIITAASSVLDQVAFYTESQSGVPSGGLSYATTSVARISATQMQIGYQISTTPAATTGSRSFSITYGFLDSAQHSLGPLTGNVFNFTVLINP